MSLTFAFYKSTKVLYTLDRTLSPSVVLHGGSSVLLLTQIYCSLGCPGFIHYHFSLPWTEARNDVNANVMQVVPGFRVRIIPVMGSIPAIFGQVMATYVVTQIAGMPVQTEPVVNLDVEHYGILHQRLIEREELQFGSAEAVEVLSCTDIHPWV